MKKEDFLSSLREYRRLFDRFCQKLREVSISAYSGLAAYMLILSFFPFIMFLLALLQHTPLSQELFISVVESFLPASFHSFMSSIINGIFQMNSATLLPVTVITALWLGSKSFLALIHGLNAVYEIEESRNYFVLRLLAVFYTILFAVLLLATLALLVFGNLLFYELTQQFPFIEEILLPIISLRSLLSFLIMLLFFTALYRNIPNHRLRSSQKKDGSKSSFSDHFPGALLATTGWMGFSFLYSYYVDHFSNYASFYGTMTVIALLMVWLYACMYMLFFGGLLNYILKEYHVQDRLPLFQKQDSN